MTPIKYVGKKARYIDGKRTFGTFIAWEGCGDVKDVEDAIAIKMLEMHPDIWQLAGDEAPVVEEPIVELDPEERIVDFANMHWNAACKYVEGCEIEEVQDLLRQELGREKPRLRVVDALEERLK